MQLNIKTVLRNGEEGLPEAVANIKLEITEKNQKSNRSISWSKETLHKG